jgi:hypothetical protein
VVLINAGRLTLRSSPGGLNDNPDYVLHLSNKEMYVFKVHAISKISRWPCGPNQCRCLNPASFPAGQYANPDFPSSPLQQRMYVLKVHRISESSILRAALEAKCLILISFFTLTTARDTCVRSPQNGLRIFDALVVLISASHSFLPAAVHAKC